MLKSFDRALWMKNFSANQKQPLFLPLKQTKVDPESNLSYTVCICPYKDPQETNSVMFLTNTGTIQKYNVN